MSDTALTGDQPVPAPEPAPLDSPAADSPNAAVPTAAVPTPAESTLAEPAVASPVPARRSSRLALRVGAAVVAAALLGVGIGLGILHVEYPDGVATATAAPSPTAAATTASPSAGPSFGAKSNGTHFGSMRDLLLPVPSGYRLGPDSGAYGNDTELTDDQRKAWVEDEVRGLPKKLQENLRQGWQSLNLRGAGVRSFAAGSDDLVVTLWLLQYHQEAVKADNAWAGALGSDSGLFRLGPQVNGHAEAHCYLPATDPGDKIDGMICSAAEGDLRVEMRVEGLAPLPKDKAVALFTSQLDRLAIPGASA